MAWRIVSVRLSVNTETWEISDVLYTVIGDGKAMTTDYDHLPTVVRDEAEKVKDEIEKKLRK